MKAIKKTKYRREKELGKDSKNDPATNINSTDEGLAISDVQDKQEL
jgi:hypothetical protein